MMNSENEVVAEVWDENDSAYAALARYRAKRTKEAAMGPLASGFIHLVLLVLLSLLICEPWGHVGFSTGSKWQKRACTH